MPERLGLALQILELLAEEGAFPGLTRGELRRKLGAAADKEITARCRELRDYPSYGGFNVRVEQSGKEWRYWLPYRERRRARAFIAAWKARKAA